MKEFLDAIRVGVHGDRQRAVTALTEYSIKSQGRGLDLTQADLSGLDLSGLDLRQAVLNRTSLYGTSLAGTDLRGAALVCAGLERTDFSGAKLNGAYVHAMSAQASKFVGADLSNLVDATGSMFHGCDLSGASLAGSVMAGTTFYQCGLTGTNFRNADLRGSAFNECTMESVDLSGCQLDDVGILRCNLKTADFRAASGENVSITRPTQASGLILANAHLTRLRLDSVRATEVDGRALRAPEMAIHRSHLSECDLRSADFSRSQWVGVSLEQVKLGDASVAGACWANVSTHGLDAERLRGEGWAATECAFPGADLRAFAGRYATFRNCDMRGIDLRQAYLYRAVVVGDPPPSACLVGAKLDGANLTQAYLAADFTNASVSGGWATYARVNQSIFANADLAGTSLFHASAVKTDFTGARLDGQRGLLFADRCPGLIEALSGGESDQDARIAELVAELGQLLSRDSGKST